MSVMGCNYCIMTVDEEGQVSHAPNCLDVTLRSVLRQLREIEKELEARSKGPYTKPSYATACADHRDALLPILREIEEALGEE